MHKGGATIHFSDILPCFGNTIKSKAVIQKKLNIFIKTFKSDIQIVAVNIHFVSSNFTLLVLKRSKNITIQNLSKSNATC